MKKITISLVLCISCACSLTACGFNNGCEACASNNRSNVTILGCCSTTPW